MVMICNIPRSVHVTRPKRRPQKNGLIAAVILVATTGQALCAPKCEYPGVNSGLLVSIALRPPQNREPKSVQQHLIFSQILSRLIKPVLSNKTRGVCRIVIWPSVFHFPDMQAHFIFDHAPVDIDMQATLPLCKAALESILLEHQPRSDAVSRIAAQESGLSVLFDKPSGEIVADAGRVLHKALGQIYQPDSIMHALVSTSAFDFESVNPDIFLQWLSQQRVAGRPATEHVFCPQNPGAEGQDTSFETNDYVASPTQSAGRLNVGFSRAEMGAMSATLHHTVVVNLSPRTGELATKKYCNQTHSFISAVPGDPPFLARILCRREVQFGEFWVIYFCDPQDCTSDRARIAADSIAHDPEISGMARKDPDGVARGPYLIDLTSWE